MLEWRIVFTLNQWQQVSLACSRDAKTVATTGAATPSCAWP
jgi:hypothetical protein